MISYAHDFKLETNTVGSNTLMFNTATGHYTDPVPSTVCIECYYILDNKYHITYSWTVTAL